MSKYFSLFVFFIFSLSIWLPQKVIAGVIINEIMYDLEGTDDKREWVELFNDSDTEEDLTNVKFNDGSNHTLNVPPKNGGQGSIKIGPKGYVILASDAATFLSEHGSFSGTVIDTVMSLSQQKDQTYSLKIVTGDNTTIDSISYSISSGASGTGDSLQKNGASGFIAATPTPGSVNGASSIVEEQEGEGTQVDTSSNSNEDSNNESPDDNGGSSASTHSSQTSVSSIKEKFYFKTDAGRKRIATINSPVEFVAKVVDSEKKSGRTIYNWSFGDGSSASGKKVSHAYLYEGVYEVVLNTAIDEDDAVSRTEVTVVPFNLEVLNYSHTGKRGLVEIKNNSPYEINLGGWSFSSASSTFFVARDTLLKPQRILKIPVQMDKMNDSLVLLFPDGSVAINFNKQTEDNSSLYSEIKAISDELSRRQSNNQLATFENEEDEVSKSVENLGRSTVGVKEATSSDDLNSRQSALLLEAFDKNDSVKEKVINAKDTVFKFFKGVFGR